ncbi:MAG: Peptidyl-tRNA hydrolase [Alphaproteobacteria bacterium MarineAlpha9_Bin3]|nr:MAG: Peptidyl-tRNA hydrolase [Alphaproteobacteria bacterium MarineAlpha9_Bin3]
MLVLVGLGNPETKYSMNRHNVGFMTIDNIIKKYSFSPLKNKFQSHIIKGHINDNPLTLVKPQTYMNLSGLSLSLIKKFYKLKNEQIIVIHDDLDLKVGDIRTKIGGSSGGHKGLKSIDSHIGKDYIRIRIGIGHPGDKQLVNNYVLGNFNKEDLFIISTLINNISSNLSFIFENINNLSQTLSEIIGKGK